MPAPKSGQAIKEELLRIIAKNIGGKTADMYRAVCVDQTPEEALASAEELLAEFVGLYKAKVELFPLKKRLKVKASVKKV